MSGSVRSFPHVTFGVHICRGNRHSYWLREGTYDAIAEQLFGSLNHQRFLLEYDTERAGTFAPLRFVPKDKIVVLGLITTKTGRVETVSEIGGKLFCEEGQWCKLDVILLTAGPICGCD